MIYYITNKDELLNRIRGINNWIEENQNTIGNANMFEIMSCLIARNNITQLSGQNEELDNEMNRMLTLRQESIAEFHMYVPEAEELFEIVKNGYSIDNEKEMELVCKLESVPFFIYNSRKRGYDGDITQPQEIQAERAIPDMMHDNVGEIQAIVNEYNNISDKTKEITNSAVNWIVENSKLKGKIDVPELSKGTSYTL